MKMKAMAIAAGFSVIGSTTSFAADINLTDTATWGNDATALDLATFNYQATYNGSFAMAYANDNAIVLQNGAGGLGNVAIVEQYGTGYNWVNIAQDDTNVANEAGVFQYGTMNGASIYQH
jgi:hypothetical protein